MQTWHFPILKGIVVNRKLPSLNEGSREITYSVSLFKLVQLSYKSRETFISILFRFLDIPWWSAYPAGITLIKGSSIYPQIQKCLYWISRSSIKDTSHKIFDLILILNLYINVLSTPPPPNPAFVRISENQYETG